MDEWIATVSQTVSKRLFTGFSLIDGFGVLSTIKQNVLPFFRTSDLNLEGLTLNLGHLISSQDLGESICYPEQKMSRL